MSGEEALAHLRALDGIGPFSAALVAIRGAGHPDLFTASEPRLGERMGRVYGMGTDPQLVAETWRPFRSWCAFLLRSASDDQLDLAAARRRGRSRERHDGGPGEAGRRRLRAG